MGGNSGVALGLRCPGKSSFGKCARPGAKLYTVFAAGAVVASLTIEVFPKAFKKDNYWAGLSTILGLVIAYYMNSLGE